MTVGPWSWKSISAKECVTTHLPNELALKIDDAKAFYLNSTVKSVLIILRVGKRGDKEKVVGVTLYEFISSADLGSSSKYSSEKLENRSGERFHENNI